MRTQYTNNGTEYFLKDGANVEGTVAQDEILDAAGNAYEGTDQELVVTSGDEGHDGDGVHSDGSLHYDQRAVDLRIWNLDSPGAVADEIAQLLGEDYDVVYGAEVNHETHIHVEKDPV